jgi:hypothetical protein
LQRERAVDDEPGAHVDLGVVLRIGLDIAVDVPVARDMMTDPPAKGTTSSVGDTGTIPPNDPPRLNAWADVLSVSDPKSMSGPA